jgi:hypothetical protein
VICGTFREDVDYCFLNIVALGGSSFIAKCDLPGPCPGDGWQLIASAGKPGKPGPKGDRGDAGTPGAAGQRGPEGHSGPIILGWKLDPDAFTVTPLMSDGTEVESIQLASLFLSYHERQWK